MYRSIGYLSVTLAKWNRDCALLQAAALAQLHLHNAGMRQPMRTDGEEGKRIFFSFLAVLQRGRIFIFEKVHVHMQKRCSLVWVTGAGAERKTHYFREMCRVRGLPA
jgi:hypothetical protein